MGALTIMFPLAASFPSVKTPIFTYYLRRKKTTKQNEKHCAVECTISWVASLMELAQRVCDVVGSLRDIGA